MTDDNPEYEMAPTSNNPNPRSTGIRGEDTMKIEEICEALNELGIDVIDVDLERYPGDVAECNIYLQWR